jgi:hypothetical protein
VISSDRNVQSEMTVEGKPRTGIHRHGYVVGILLQIQCQYLNYKLS